MRPFNFLVRVGGARSLFARTTQMCDGQRWTRDIYDELASGPVGGTGNAQHTIGATGGERFR
jgi:hypothetical protein